MGWSSALTTQPAAPASAPSFASRPVMLERIDWDRLVTLDFETYFDQQYTLGASKLSTSEYIRDARFKAQMVGIKIGRKAARVYSGARIAPALAAINWRTHALLCHNTAFDGFILSQHYNIVPARYYDTLSMARGLHSNEIGASLQDVSVFYGGQGKIEGALDLSKGVRDWNKALIAQMAEYCARDVHETFRIFEAMVKAYPAEELDLIHIAMRMFCDPVLRVDIPRVQAEYEREVAKRKALLIDAVPDLDAWDARGALDKKSGRDTLTGDERKVAIARKVLGSNEKFITLLTDAGVHEADIPHKISAAWMKLDKEQREARIDEKWTYAFARDDLEFIDLPERVWTLRDDLNPDKPGDVMRAVAMQERLRGLIDARLAVKSTTNITRAERFLEAGKNGMRLPVGYSYFRAHTGRFGGNNKMNMQNLMRGGELRQSILAARGHALAVCDSGQIEARVNGWLWEQDDLMQAFRASDAYDAEVAGTPKDKRRPMRENERDAYCRFADVVYGRTIWKADATERFVGKVCVLGLGYQMGVDRFQMTLAQGALGGPRVSFLREQCAFIVNAYRRANFKIAEGWKRCTAIIEDMAAGVSGEYKCIQWGGDDDGNGQIVLPNGMTLKYPRLRKAPNEDKGYDEWTYRSGDVPKKIYGGLLCENLIQALARIIVMQQMLTIDKKYRCVMTTHDEVVAHPKLYEAGKCYQFMYQCMTTAPWWCPDIPLAAEGGWAENYSK